MKPLNGSLASTIICWALSCLKTKLLRSLLGELCGGILAVGLDDGVREAVLHDKELEMLSLMRCWPFLGHDDRAAQASDGLHHGEDGDVLGPLSQLFS